MKESADKILPDLQTCLLCEDVRQEINGNFLLVGVLGGITVPSLPVTALKLLLFTRWCCGLGAFASEFRILLPDNTSVIAANRTSFELKNTEDSLTQVTLFGNVQFQQPGTHWVEVLLDGSMQLRFPLPVRVIPPPKQ